MRYLSEQHHIVSQCEDSLDLKSSLVNQAEYLISYGYRHLLSSRIVAQFHRRAINLHISFLPWNRGADPNLWSFLENTPKGITVHYIDAKLDTGPVLAQRELQFDDSETLRTTYERLDAAIQALFKDVWPKISRGEQPSTAQPSSGTFHRAADRKRFEHLLVNGWDTPVGVLKGKGVEAVRKI
jgi:methionyl-tRNA formyltransferase